MADHRILKILVIHGYRQNAKSSYEKTGSFRKGLKRFAEFVYITAPHLIQPSNAETTTDSGEYGWWFSNPNERSFNASDETNSQLGHDESIELIKKTFSEKGPFDGVLGFSQGATVVAHLCMLRQMEESSIQFQFAILCAGFKSRYSDHASYYKEKISCPTLHIFGDTDKVIPKEKSEELLTAFENPEVLRHGGGHFLPATSAEKKIYHAFLARFQTSST